MADVRERVVAPLSREALGFHKKVLEKPDGRPLTLYARQPLPEGIVAPSPSPGPHAPNGHFRWHPLRGEWVAYATHRQNRTFLPPPEWDPLEPTKDEKSPTEVPQGPWEVAVFENLFPTLAPAAHDPPSTIVETRPSEGVCEVVVFQQEQRGSLGALPLWRVELVLAVLGDRTRVLGERADVKHVFPFENRGVEVGVTLHHPHGQIYAYPFVPPVAARELAQQRAHHAGHGRGLLEMLIESELSVSRRMIYTGPSAVAFMPVCARYSYEVWVAPRRPVPLLSVLSADERHDLARALKTVLMKYDALWGKPMPYILVFHQAPTDGEPHPEAHLHVEIYPALRMPGRLKYLAGSEIGAGVFTADTLPEEKVQELQKVEVTVD